VGRDPQLEKRWSKAIWMKSNKIHKLKEALNPNFLNLIIGKNFGF